MAYIRNYPYLLTKLFVSRISVNSDHVDLWMTKVNIENGKFVSREYKVSDKCDIFIYSKFNMCVYNIWLKFNECFIILILFSLVPKIKWINI